MRSKSYYKYCEKKATLKRKWYLALKIWNPIKILSISVCPHCLGLKTPSHRPLTTIVPGTRAIFTSFFLSLTLIPIIFLLSSLIKRYKNGRIFFYLIRFVKSDVFLTCCVFFAMSGDSLPQKHFTMCPSMAVAFTETMAWAALSWEENLKRKTAVKIIKQNLYQAIQKIHTVL